MQTVAFGYGDPGTWGGCKPYYEIGIKQAKLTRIERKKRSDACVEFMILQWQGLTCWSSGLNAVLFGKTKSERNRFYYECRKRGLKVENDTIQKRRL